MEQHGAKDAKAAFAKIPVAKVEQLAEAAAIIFGTPTRFGNMAGQNRFALSTRPVGRQSRKRFRFYRDSTWRTRNDNYQLSHNFAISMIIVGVPYSERGLTYREDISGGTPYGATTLAGPDGSQRPSENELNIARHQGKHVAEIAAKLVQK